MTTTNISFGKTVTLSQAANLIRHVPEVRYALIGEPGIGKSSIMSFFERELGDSYAYAYFDCAQKDLGDVAMPSINRELRVTEYFPNAALQLQTGKPAVIMLDEFSKAPVPVQNMLHPLLEARNPRLGDIPLPEGSIVFLTGNLSSDGVGDVLKAHTRNRVTTLYVSKPTAQEWLAWAVNSNIDPVIMAWVDRFPHALASYTDGDQNSNPYIYNPKQMQFAFVSPRSLQRASNIVSRRKLFDDDSLIAALSGTLGEAAARDIQAFVSYQDQLPTWENIVNHPDTAPVPESGGACAVLVFTAIERVDKKSITPFMQYLDRFEPEWQATFAINIAKNPNKQVVAFSSQAFTRWVRENEDVL